MIISDFTITFYLLLEHKSWEVFLKVAFNYEIHSMFLWHVHCHRIFLHAHCSIFIARISSRHYQLLYLIIALFALCFAFRHAYEMNRKLREKLINYMSYFTENRAMASRWKLISLNYIELLENVCTRANGFLRKSVLTSCASHAVFISLRGHPCLPNRITCSSGLLFQNRCQIFLESGYFFQSV